MGGKSVKKYIEDIERDFIKNEDLTNKIKYEVDKLTIETQNNSISLLKFRPPYYDVLISSRKEDIDNIKKEYDRKLELYERKFEEQDKKIEELKKLIMNK